VLSRIGSGWVTSSSSAAAQIQQQIPIIFRIDIEPDELFIDRSQRLPWKGYEGAVAFFRSIRAQMAAATKSPVRLCWFFRMDPQIAETYGSPEWAVTEYPSYVRFFEAHGDEIGLHTHPYRWVSEHDRWCLDHANQEWVDHCVRMSFASYRRIFGRDCLSFSFGDRWMNDATLTLLESLGARFEFTVEPGYEERPSHHMHELYTGFLPAYTTVPRSPYRPSRFDFRRADLSNESQIWMIPMTTGYFPHGVVRLLYYTLRGTRVRKSEFRTLNPIHNWKTFQTIIHQALDGFERPYLSMVVRADVFAKPYLLKNVRANLDWFLRRPDIERFVFATPAEALGILGLRSLETRT